MFGDDGQGLDASTALELVAQGLCQITHGVKVTGAALMNPAKQLRGAKPLFTQLLAESRQTVEIKFQKIGGHCALPGVGRTQSSPWRRYPTCAGTGMGTPISARVNVQAREEESHFCLGSFRSVGAMHCIGIDAVREVGADGAGFCLLGVRGAHEFAV